MERTTRRPMKQSSPATLSHSMNSGVSSMVRRSSSLRKRSAALGDERPAAAASSFNEIRAFRASKARQAAG
jgi:hypothetical protein